MFAKVIVDIVHSNVDRVFEYKIKDEQQIALGQRVLVPFGISNKVIEGFVIETSETSEYDEKKIKAIIQPLESYPVLNADQLELAEYMREEYGCTLAEAIRLMLPSRLHGLREKMLLCAKVISSDISCLYTKNGKEKAPAQIKVYNYLSKNGETLVCDIEKKIKGAGNAVNGLAEKGIIAVYKKEIERKPYENAGKIKKLVTLNKEQSYAVETISNALESGGNFLIHGITGSGKTEVYMRVVQRCLEKGRGAIILVPEIALTPQAVERYRSSFGDEVALLHSRLSGGERFDEWKRILKGECRVVLGARSAIFAPVKDLGLVIIDEEHEGTYQSDSFPRYNAKALAKARIKNKGCLVLGSATPAVETYYKQTQGEYSLLELTERANKKPLPKTIVADMTEELKNGNKTIISNVLYEKIQERLNKKEQIILLLNKRGYASFVMCRGCGYVIKCPHCDVSLAYHKHEGSRVKCHYCGFEERVTRECPSCKKPFMKHVGIGTQQVEEQVKKMFPAAKLLRMDFDTTRTKDSHYEIFNSFISREADILIGTQMIAKGLDFPGVTLVGIICADNMFNLPDFRARERAFALITQASGRAGRGESGGEVIIQTYLKDNRALAYAIRQDYNSFYSYEIDLRSKTDYPPFAVFCRIIVSSPSNDNAFDTVKKLNQAVFNKVKAVGENKLLYQCTPCPIGLLKDMHRYQILIKLRATEQSQEFLKALNAYLRKYDAGKNVYVDFEINPKNMM